MMTADRLLHDTLEYSKRRGLTWGIGHAQLSLGVLAFMMGDMGQAVSRMSESLLVREQLQDARGICDCLGMMAVFASVAGDAVGVAEGRALPPGDAIHLAIEEMSTLASSAASVA
jgi:hypothetical protein